MSLSLTSVSENPSVMNITRQVLIALILVIVFIELSDEKNRNKRRRRRRFGIRKRVNTVNRRTIGGRSRPNMGTIHGRSAPRRSGRPSSRRSGRKHLRRNGAASRRHRRIRGRGRNLIRGRGRGRRPGQNRLTYAPMKHAVTKMPTTDEFDGYDDDFRLPKQFCSCATGEPEYNEEWEQSHSR